MRFLVDAQLPPALARWLGERGHDASHVIDVSLERSGDRIIWDHALAIGAVIVTKDEDFPIRKALEPVGPPIVWVRVGNTTKRELLVHFERHLPAVLSALDRRDPVVEIA